MKFKLYKLKSTTERGWKRVHIKVKLNSLALALRELEILHSKRKNYMEVITLVVIEPEGTTEFYSDNLVPIVKLNRSETTEAR
jgi:hypothetical protein